MRFQHRHDNRVAKCATSSARTRRVSAQATKTYDSSSGEILAAASCKAQAAGRDMQRSRPALERRIAAAVMIAALAGGLVAVAAIRWSPAGQAHVKPGSAAADAIANAISRG